MKTQPYAAGYALDLGEGLQASLHPDGGLSLEGEGGAADLSPAQVEALAALLSLASNVRSAAKRRRARADYSARYGE